MSLQYDVHIHSCYMDAECYKCHKRNNVFLMASIDLIWSFQGAAVKHATHWGSGDDFIF